MSSFLPPGRAREAGGTQRLTRGLLLALVVGGAFTTATAVAKPPGEAIGVAPKLGKARPTTVSKSRSRAVVRPSRTPLRPSKPGTTTPPPGEGSNNISPPEACVIKTSEIINTKVDIGAQYSLMRKMSGDLYSRTEASSMLKAVEDGRLAGILLPPRKAVSDRGKRMTPKKGYWELIPKGKTSTCLKEPNGEAPMILYRTDMTAPQIDLALTNAWRECGLLNLPEPCEYVVNLHKPEVECNTDQDCITKKKGDFCNLDTHTCGVDFPPTVIPGDSCSYPRCDASVSTNVYAACGMTSSNVPIECLPKAGSKCGVCANVSSKAQTCHAANEAKHTTERSKCKAAHSPGKTLKYGAECAEEIVKCAEGDAGACLKAGSCFVSPEPYNEFKQCLNTESARYLREGKRCSGL